MLGKQQRGLGGFGLWSWRLGPRDGRLGVSHPSQGHYPSFTSQFFSPWASGRGEPNGNEFLEVGGMGVPKRETRPRLERRGWCCRLLRSLWEQRRSKSTGPPQLGMLFPALASLRLLERAWRRYCPRLAAWRGTQPCEPRAACPGGW